MIINEKTKEFFFLLELYNTRIINYMLQLKQWQNHIITTRKKKKPILCAQHTTENLTQQTKRN